MTSFGLKEVVNEPTRIHFVLVGWDGEGEFDAASVEVYSRGEALVIHVSDYDDVPLTIEVNK